MAIIDKIKVGSTTYDVSPSASGTLNTTGTTKFASSDVAQGSATGWTNVNQITTSDNHATLFTKITQMAKNVRYLYNVLGTGFSTGSTVKSQIDSKAPSSHSHSVGQLPTSSTQVNSNNYIPTSALIYSMNQTLTSLNDATKNFGNSFIKSITYEGSYTTETVSTDGLLNWLKENCSSTNPIRTKISRLYDIVFFFDITFGVNPDNSSWTYSTNKYLYSLKDLFEFNYRYLGGFVFTKKIANTWTSGQSIYGGASKDKLIGPYIEYGVAPKPFVKYRITNGNNAYYIDRYVDTFDSKYDNNNISYQILYRNMKPSKYLVYGIDLEDNISNIVNNE